MSKYFRLLSALAKNNLAREMEYRANFLLWLMIEIFWTLAQVGMVGLFFTFGDEVHGWTKYQFFLLVGIFRCIEGIFHIFFHNNLLNFPDNIKTGDFDFFLSRPIDPQFLMTTRIHSWDEIGTFITGIAITIFSLFHLQIGLGMSLVIQLIFLCLCGLVSLYSLMLFFSSLSFFLTRMTALVSIWDVISKCLRIPADLLSQNHVAASLLLFPIIIVTTLPAQIITGKISSAFLLWELTGSVLLFILSRKFFFFALRHYSSASS
jgi:ABC-2 type transport system permease protein